MNEEPEQPPLTPDYDARAVPIPEHPPAPETVAETIPEAAPAQQESKAQETIEALRAENKALRDQVAKLRAKRQNQRDFQLVDAQVRLLEIRKYLLQHKPELWQSFIESHPWFN